MRTHGTAQQIGTRTDQCDATATRRTSDGGRAFVLADGIGSSPAVRNWTRTITQRIAILTARSLQPHEAITAVQAEITSTPGWDNWLDAVPGACVVAAVTGPDKLLRVAWIGDCRAYLLHPDGHLQRLTSDHNRRALLEAANLPVPKSARNHVVRCMGHPVPDEYDECPGLPRDGEELAPEWTAVHDRAGTRLLLASDGLYEPIDDAGQDLAGDLALYTDPAEAAEWLVATAMAVGGLHRDNATALVADLT
mgnify:CR=1 FL=1